MIAALFVERLGVYAGLSDVELWDVSRDARRYAGPWPVVAHPPCQRWGRYWFGSPSGMPARRTSDLFLGPVGERFTLGDDGGCFAAALDAVHRWGGVLEHPAGSAAWEVFGIDAPPRVGGWVRSHAGWTCHVEQGHYGHRARKPTWLYAVGCGEPPPPLRWGPSVGTVEVERQGRAERLATPAPFRDVLLGIVRARLAEVAA